MNRFESQVLSRVPMAMALETLLEYAFDVPMLEEIFEEHRGSGWAGKVPLALLVDLVISALVEHGGSGKQSFAAARANGRLEATDDAVYGKLRRLPPPMSEALLQQASQRLRTILPPNLANPVPPTLRSFKVLAVDGKKLKKLPKRLKPVRGVSGKVLGGKAVVGLLLNEGLIVGMHASPDGEANDAPLTPTLVERCCEQFTERQVYVADRQFCDLKIPRMIDSLGHAFVIRFSKKMRFFPERERETRDARGRRILQAWGYLGSPRDKRRMFLRQVTLVREGEENIVLVTNLREADSVSAEDLLEVYLYRWSIERVFQKITEVFALNEWIASSPQGAIFQFALCSLLYNLVEVVRSHIAVLQDRSAESLSAEIIFRDIRKQVQAKQLLAPGCSSTEPCQSTKSVQKRLTTLLQTEWTERWLKAPPKKNKPPPKRRQVRGGHSSAYKLIQQAKRSPPR